jgi:hypothetical protein
LGEKGDGRPYVSAPLPQNRKTFPTSPHLQEIVAQADQSPFGFDLLQSPKEKLTESSSLFDLSEDCFHTVFSLGVNLPSLFGFQLPAHPVHCAHIFGDASSWSRLGLFRMFDPITTDEGLHEVAVNIFHVVRTEVTRVSKDSVRYLAKIVFYLLNHRNELSLVIGVLGNIRIDNDRGITINGSLSIVGMFKGFGGPIAHDSAFWVREITLLLGFVRSWKPFGTTTALPGWIPISV